MINNIGLILSIMRSPNAPTSEDAMALTKASLKRKHDSDNSEFEPDNSVYAQYN